MQVLHKLFSIYFHLFFKKAVFKLFSVKKDVDSLLFVNKIKKTATKYRSGFGGGGVIYF